jgi:hypothetical protein
VRTSAIAELLDRGFRIAQQIGLYDHRPFFLVFGGHLGAFGSIGGDSLHGMAKTVGHGLGLDTVDLFDNGGKAGLTAVVAGGGDQEKILGAGIESGCTTYITGTVVHRWDRGLNPKGKSELSQAGAGE